MAKEVHKIQIGHIAVHAIAYINIIQAIVIGIEQQGAPAPVGSANTNVIGYFGKVPLPLFTCKTVFHVLVVEAYVQFIAILDRYYSKAAQRF